MPVPATLPCREPTHAFKMTYPYSSASVEAFLLLQGCFWVSAKLLLINTEDAKRLHLA